mgnify:FL=1
MDYYKLGQRIRKYRRAQKLSQEHLAEAVGMSVTHMSHIETGNTKLSLAVFVSIAEALQVQTDELLYDHRAPRTITTNEIVKTLEESTPQQLRILEEIIKATKTALEKHWEP